MSCIRAARLQLHLQCAIGRRLFSTSSPARARKPRPTFKHSKAMLEPNLTYDTPFIEDSIGTPQGKKGFGAAYKVYNDPPTLQVVETRAKEERKKAESSGDKSKDLKREKEQKQLTSRELIEQNNPKYHLPVHHLNLSKLHRYVMVEKRVVQMTGKGRIASFYALIIVGNGQGLMGYGEGKGPEANTARDKAFIQAVRLMDYVDRFEERTLWSNLNT